MFRRTPDGVYKSSALDAFDWLDHGFSTRLSADWPGDYTQLKQIHSNTVVEIAQHRGSAGHGDALVTSVPGQFIGIRTADCVPILLADPSTRTVAAVHAGWRGTVARIAAETVNTLVRNGADPDRMVAAIGPSIGGCCFEVGPEVAVEFGVSGRTCIDLIAKNRAQLENAGLRAANIDAGELCTVCGGSEFHSWRRDRDRSGRMVAAIRINAPR